MLESEPATDRIDTVANAMKQGSQEPASEIALVAKTQRYFKVFIDEFDGDFATEIRAVKRFPKTLTRFNLKEHRKLAQIQDYYSGLARYIYTQTNLENLFLAILGKEQDQYVSEVSKIITEKTGSIFHSTLYDKYSKRRETKVVRQPHVRMDHDESLVFLSSFASAVGTVFDLIQRDRPAAQSSIRDRIDKSAKFAPVFEHSGGRIRYRERSSTKSIAERKQIVRIRCDELINICKLKENQQPDLTRLVMRYTDALRVLRRDRGIYRLLLAGLDIQTLLKIKSELAPNEDDNIPLDPPLLMATNALLIAHAGLANLFPDVNVIVGQLDRFRAQSSSLDALRDRILDPVLDQLASSQGIFDDQTLNLTTKLKALDDSERKVGGSPSRALTSAKLAWLRGALAAIGRHVLDHATEAMRLAREATIKEAVSAAFKNPTTLSASIVAFIVAAQPALLRIADALQASFGWLRPFLSYLGL
jgi:hypothetical protein